MTMLTGTAQERNRSPVRFFDGVRRVSTHMTHHAPILSQAVLSILDGPHLSILATVDADGRPQTSVIFVKRDGDHILFSTIKGRRKTINMERDPRVNLLMHPLPVGGAAYATVSGTVEMVDDPDAAFHEEIYGLYMGGATPPPEPGAQRVIVRIIPARVYDPAA
jgi:PPOX class probable F420-dependent enzyme